MNQVAVDSNPVGNLAALHEESVPEYHCPLGRFIEVYPEKMKLFNGLIKFSLLDGEVKWLIVWMLLSHFDGSVQVKSTVM